MELKSYFSDAIKNKDSGELFSVKVNSQLAYYRDGYQTNLYHLEKSITSYNDRYGSLDGYSIKGICL